MMIAVAVDRDRDDRGLFSPRYRDRGHLAVDISTAMKALHVHDERTGLQSRVTVSQKKQILKDVIFGSMITL